MGSLPIHFKLLALFLKPYGQYEFCPQNGVSMVLWLRNLFDSCPWEDVALWESLIYSWAVYVSFYSALASSFISCASCSEPIKIQALGYKELAHTFRTRIISIALTDPSLREMQFLSPQPRPIESEALRVRPSNLYFNNPSP